MLIEQSCYFCKAPFVEGDEIVVKRKHVLHKSCWDENEYQCPEYGRHCKQGRHYYNSKIYLIRTTHLFIFHGLLLEHLQALLPGLTLRPTYTIAKICCS